jgi:hypothetical protein
MIRAKARERRPLLLMGAVTNSLSRNVRGSVDALWRRFELNDALTSLGIPPHPHRALEEPTLLGRAVFLDQLLDAGKPFRRADPIVLHARSA